MRAYIIRRLLLVIPTLLLVTLVIFIMIRLIPGNVIDAILASSDVIGGVDVDEPYVLRALGLDVPVHVQYGRWLGVLPDPRADGSFSGLFQGSFGNSLQTGMPVTREITGRLPTSLQLAILSLLIMVITSLPVGIYSAMRQDTAGDYVSRSFATVLIALPSFWVALLIILTGSLWFGWSPPLMFISFTKDPIGNLRQLIIPASVLSMAALGGNMRMTRSMMLEVLRQDYIRTAWAKGLRERVVMMRHALKNALIPIVTLLGMRLSGLIGGAVIIETIFGIPGIGRLLVEALRVRDYTLISGIVFFFAAFLVLINLMVDLTYGFLDPRVHYK